MLNKHSGLLGISGVSHDMRSLLEAEIAGDPRAKLAIDVFCYRLRKYVAAYLGVLGGVDGLAFAGGIGENADAVRARALAGLDGLASSSTRCATPRRAASRPRSHRPVRPRASSCPTNEELLIARDTFTIVSGAH